jgi:hypothetical protein
MMASLTKDGFVKKQLQTQVLSISVNHKVNFHPMQIKGYMLASCSCFTKFFGQIHYYIYSFYSVA